MGLSQIQAKYLGDNLVLLTGAEDGVVSEFIADEKVWL